MPGDSLYITSRRSPEREARMSRERHPAARMRPRQRGCLRSAHVPSLSFFAVQIFLNGRVGPCTAKTEEARARI